MNTYRRAAAALSPLHLVAQRERSARARLKEKLQNAAYKQDAGDGQVGLELGLVRVGRRGGGQGGLAPASARRAHGWGRVALVCTSRNTQEYTRIYFWACKKCEYAYLSGFPSVFHI